MVDVCCLEEKFFAGVLIGVTSGGLWYNVFLGIGSCYDDPPASVTSTPNAGIAGIATTLC